MILNHEIYRLFNSFIAIQHIACQGIFNTQKINISLKNEATPLFIGPGTFQQPEN